MAGIALQSNIFRNGPTNPPIGPSKPPDITYGSPSAFTSAANTQAADYDRMMGQYNDLLKTAQSSPITPSRITPITANYNPSSDVANSLSNLSSLSSTGGYSPGDIQNIRARAVSPVRAIYAAGQRKLDQSKALQGGYSPNYAATSAKMARELSEQIGQQMTNIEGTIAQNQAQNKIAIAPSYASAAGNENALRASTDRANADAANRAAEENAQMEMQAKTLNTQRPENIVNSMRQLYGTTPALTNMYGEDVATAARLRQQQQQIDQERDNQRVMQQLGLIRPFLG